MKNSNIPWLGIQFSSNFDHNTIHKNWQTSTIIFSTIKYDEPFVDLSSISTRINQFNPHKTEKTLKCQMPINSLKLGRIFRVFLTYSYFYIFRVNLRSWRLFLTELQHGKKIKPRPSLIYNYYTAHYAS